MAAAGPGEEPRYPELGQALKRARQALHMSREQLGALSGIDISISFISYVERGEKRPSPEVLRGICRVLSLDFTEMSALAGYADRPHGDVAIYTTQEKAAPLRRLEELYDAAELSSIERAVAHLLVGLRVERAPGSPAADEAQDEDEDAG